MVSWKRRPGQPPPDTDPAIQFASIGEVTPDPDPAPARNEDERPPDPALSFVTIVPDQPTLVDTGPGWVDPAPPPPPPPPVPMPELDATPIAPLMAGAELSTFAREPWWTNRGWTKLVPSGGPRDIVAQFGTHGSVVVGGASIRGRKHRLYGGPNQDAFAMATLASTGESADGGWLMIAVCDGMGSAEYSAFGATVTAELMTALLTGAARHAGPDDDIDQVRVILTGQADRGLAELGRAVRQQVDVERNDWTLQPHHPPVGTPFDDLQCTLSFAVVRLRTDADGTRPALIGIIGDSPAFVLDGEGFIPIDGSKDGNGLWSSATAGALGAEGWAISRTSVAPGRPLLLTSDGVGNFLHHDGASTRIGRYIAERWSRPVDQLEFLRDLSFDLSSADDDRTAVVVWSEG